MKPINIIRKLNESENIEDYREDIEDCMIKLSRAEIGDDITSTKQVDDFVKDSIPKELYKDYDSKVKGIKDLSSRVETATNFLSSLIYGTDDSKDNDKEKLEDEYFSLLKSRFDELNILDNVLSNIRDQLFPDLVVDTDSSRYIISKSKGRYLRAEVSFKNRFWDILYIDFLPDRKYDENNDDLQRDIDLVKNNKVIATGIIKYRKDNVYDGSPALTRSYSYKPDGTFRIDKRNKKGMNYHY